MNTAHLTSLFEHSTEGIILTKGRGPVVLVNPAAERIFGYTANELIGKSIEILIPDRFQPRHSALREGFCQNPQNRVMGSGRDLFGRRQDGTEFPVEVSLSFYTKDNELFVIAFIVDITERKKIEVEMREQQRELAKMAVTLKELNAGLERKVEERTAGLQDVLEKLEKSKSELNDALQKEIQLNEIKSRFMSIASHEFRTPLSTVLSSASLLSKYTTTEEHNKRERHIEKIKSSVRSLNGILEDFLSLGKLEAGKIDTRPVLFNVQEFMVGVIEEMNSLLKAGQRLNIKQAGNSDTVTDKRLLKNVLINLVTNAIKFSEEGSHIDIFIEADESVLVIKVTDKGIGIPDDELNNLFSSFYRARNAVNIQGTGLGLHIVKRYLELLNGSIEVDSVLGTGSTFTVIIPVTFNQIT